MRPWPCIPTCVSRCLRARSGEVEVREDFAEERPDGGEVRDVHCYGCFAEVPIHINVRDEGWDETVHLGEDGRDDDEEAHAEDEEEDDFLLDGEAHLHEDWDADCEDRHVAWYA